MLGGDLIQAFEFSLVFFAVYNLHLAAHSETTTPVLRNLAVAVLFGVLAYFVPSLL